MSHKQQNKLAEVDTLSTDLHATVAKTKKNFTILSCAKYNMNS